MYQKLKDNMVKSMFDIFKSTECLKYTTVLLAQMDKKCFFAVFTRGNNKSILYLGNELIS